MNGSINLLEIKNGLPGITVDLCKAYYEACMVCLHLNNHTDGVSLDLKGDVAASFLLHWEDYFDEQIDRAWQDREVCTEYGAVCISALLVKECTDYTIIRRARKGSGIDYWLGKDDDIVFQNSARLEISGIFKESETNPVAKRFRIKMKQSKQSDETRLPAYISIVEFSHPKAIFAKQTQ
jgi:hypothetical protein